MDVAVSGSSGLIGGALCDRLEERGDTVRRLVRRPTGSPREVHWDPDRSLLDPGSLEGVDAVVHLAGAGIANRRWTRSRMDLILGSRTRGTHLISSAMAESCQAGAGPGVLVSGSAIGFYGDRSDEPLDETSSRGGGFLADVCVAWEAATRTAESAGIRVAHARTGIVLSPRGGLLGAQLSLFRLGLGGPLGPGTQWMSWISLRDEVSALCWLIDNEVCGPVNLVSPSPVTNAGFAASLGRAVRRPARLRTPALVPAVPFGRRLVAELMLSSAVVRPNVLQEGGFIFADTSLDDALRSELDLT
ncbi:MAG: TIGR01777 family protein [Acidobacteria bacterium]|nr:TIGR01777 family protein [Acidobacteriota bacterium]MDP7549995.1 TIGR01777 family oxidoreductase [Acidimicrobiales bacterium]